MTTVGAGSRRRHLWLVAVVAGLAACSTPSPAPRPSTASSPARPFPPSPPEERGAAIGVVSPSYLTVIRDEIPAQILQVAYSIPDPETVVSAEVRVHIGELGIIASQRVLPHADGVLHLALKAVYRSVGDHVRVRAVCPTGVTEWHSVGQMPLEHDRRMDDVLHISSVTPRSIPWTSAMEEQHPAYGTRLTISGPKLSADCRIEAQVNRRPIELDNVLFKKRYFEGKLMNRDINYRRVSPRFAELQLSIKRKSGKRLMATKYVPFA